LRMLITGAFGNICKAVIKEAYKRHHKITVFEIDNKKTRKITPQHRSKIEKIVFGDMRDFKNVKNAVQDCNVDDSSRGNNPSAIKKNRE